MIVVSAWLNGLRIAALACGAFLIGYTTLLLGAIVFNFKKVHSYRRKRHIVAIATSYLLVAFALWIAIVGRALAGSPITWRLPIACVAFPLGIYALRQMMKEGQ
jgi:hypothetical protein